MKSKTESLLQMRHLEATAVIWHFHEFFVLKNHQILTNFDILTWKMSQAKQHMQIHKEAGGYENRNQPQPTATNRNQPGCGFYTQYKNRNPLYLTTATSLRFLYPV